MSELLGEPHHSRSRKSAQVQTGYKPHELLGTPSLDLVHSDGFRDARSLVSEGGSARTLTTETQGSI
jgi:hypothetical protein